MIEKYDEVEIVGMGWEPEFCHHWFVQDFCSNGAEAIISRFTPSLNTIMIANLKLVRKMTFTNVTEQFLQQFKCVTKGCSDLRDHKGDCNNKVKLIGPPREVPKRNLTREDKIALLATIAGEPSELTCIMCSTKKIKGEIVCGECGSTCYYWKGESIQPIIGKDLLVRWTLVESSTYTKSG